MSRSISQLNDLRRNARGTIEQSNDASKMSGNGHRRPAGFSMPRFDPLHPIQWIIQCNLVKRHETECLAATIERHREVVDEQLDASLSSEKKASRIGQIEQDNDAESNLAEALSKTQTRLSSFCQHYQRLTAINTSNQIDAIDQANIDPEIAEALKASMRRTARWTFVELESAALGEDFDPATFGGAV